MNPLNPLPKTLQRQVESLEQAQRHWSLRQEARKTDSGRAGRPFTIALAREAGTPGTLLAHEIGRRLGWTVYDYELVQKIAQEMGLHAKLLESVDERRKSWLLESIEALASAPNVTESGYVRQLITTVLSLAELGHCVIVGRGAPAFLPAETTLRVRLVGKLEDRIALASRRQNLPRDQAARWVADKERERLQFVKAHFFKDAADPDGYDLLLNTSRWSMNDCADLTIQALRRAENPTADKPAVSS